MDDHPLMGLAKCKVGPDTHVILVEPNHAKNIPSGGDAAQANKIAAEMGACTPVERLHAVRSVTAAKMETLGIVTCTRSRDFGLDA